jgi:hypothetical protein
MGIVKLLSKPHTQAMLGTSLGVMESMMAYKAPTCGEEEVSTGFRQPGESVKGGVVNFNKNGGRETRFVEEFHPV